ncbi:MAG: hypothetical protein JXQ81_03775 [Desulfuromonadales bacterium]|nr:hypothetical protein [Desulfuromonadales bacterium]MBN2791608.1 hypothetical protein [Desulfuromonadales bacterium]
MVTCTAQTYCTASFERQLKLLQRSDKRGSAAAKRAEKLVYSLASGQLSSAELLAKRTKNGELRLDNCWKFDLGSGYRLISLREKEALYFTFVGTHDACDRWLDKRRTEKVNFDPAQLKLISVNSKEPPGEELPAELLTAEAEYEAYIASKLDEKTLRYLFRGLL